MKTFNTYITERLTLSQHKQFFSIDIETIEHKNCMQILKNAYTKESFFKQYPKDANITWYYTCFTNRDNKDNDKREWFKYIFGKSKNISKGDIRGIFVKKLKDALKVKHIYNYQLREVNGFTNSVVSLTIVSPDGDDKKTYCSSIIFSTNEKDLKNIYDIFTVKDVWKPIEIDINKLYEGN